MRCASVLLVLLVLGSFALHRDPGDQVQLGPAAADCRPAPRRRRRGQPPGPLGTRYAIELRSFSGKRAGKMRSPSRPPCAKPARSPVSGSSTTATAPPSTRAASAGRTTTTPRPVSNASAGPGSRAAAPFRRAEMISIDPNREGVADRWDLRPHHGLRSLAVELYDAARPETSASGPKTAPPSCVRKRPGRLLLPGQLPGLRVRGAFSIPRWTTCCRAASRFPAPHPGAAKTLPPDPAQR